MKMSETERNLDQLLSRWFKNTWEYTGDGKFKIGVYNPDWIYTQDNKKLILELNGCFWHGCEQCGFGEKTLKRKKDKFKLQQYKRKGWKCVVVWEHEVNGDIFALKKRLKEFVEVA